MMAGKVGALVGITTAQVSLVLTPIPGTHHFKDFGLLVVCPRINCCSDYRQSKLEYLLISAARELIRVSPVLMWPVALWARISRTDS